ncbi:hypothetical protein Y032_0726g1868 [Ancylostoma ceylanicum]|nr:hypothetical protein Y032_0726g1868 [Ancylostoma ceylanicum]
MDEADLAEYNRFYGMRFIYRSMTCSKDKELFKEYCLKAVKKKQAFWDDEKVIQWIMTGALSPNAHSTIPGDENLLHEAQGVLDAIAEKLDDKNKEED